MRGPWHPIKRYAVLCLLGGLALAVLTPAYIAHVAPRLAGYLLHPELFLLQMVPYALCAGLWFPWRAAAAAKIGLGLSVTLLVVACVLYVPMLIRAGSQGGDMIAFAFLLISATTTVAVVGVSLIAFVVARGSLRPPPDR
jgi:hypothetical protein